MQNSSVKLKLENCTRMYDLTKGRGVTVLTVFFKRAVELVERDLAQRKRGSPAR